MVLPSLEENECGNGYAEPDEKDEQTLNQKFKQSSDLS